MIISEARYCGFERRKYARCAGLSGMSFVHKLLITCRSGKAFAQHPANTRHILPAQRILPKAHSFFHHCHHSVIFPVETNVTEMVFYS